MKIIYVHGLDSSTKSTKAILLQRYCDQHHPNLNVMRPDLNESPDRVFRRLCQYVHEAQNNGERVVLIGSSLGGYFSTLVGNQTGCLVVLLNPSTQPHITLKRFIDNSVVAAANNNSDVIVYTTTGGWNLTLKDLAWFEHHKLTDVKYPHKVVAIVKAGDELLAPTIAIDFYKGQHVTVEVQEGGDHRMTDFDVQLPKVMDYVSALSNQLSDK